MILWRIPDGQRICHRRTGTDIGLSEVAFSPNRTWIAACGNRYAWVWFLEGEEVYPFRTFDTEEDSVHQVVFDPSGEFLFALHSGHVIDGWRIRDGVRGQKDRLPWRDVEYRWQQAQGPQLRMGVRVSALEGPSRRGNMAGERDHRVVARPGPADRSCHPKSLCDLAGRFGIRVRGDQRVPKGVIVMADFLSEFRRALAVIPMTHSRAEHVVVECRSSRAKPGVLAAATRRLCFSAFGIQDGGPAAISLPSISGRANAMSITFPEHRTKHFRSGVFARIIEDWRRIKNDASPGFRWIRSLRPPQQGLGSACRSELRGQMKYTSCIGCSGDGSIVAWAGGGSSGEPIGAYIWQPRLGRLDFFTLQSAPFDVDIAADGSRIAFVFGKTTIICLIDGDGRVAMDSLELVATDGDAFHRVCFSPDSRCLALGLESGRVQVARVDDARTLWSEEGHPGKFVRGLAWSGETLVSGGDDAGVVVWDAASGTILCRFTNLAAEVSSVNVCGHLVAAGTGVDDFKLMDVMLEGQSINDYQMKCSRVYLWDTRTGREVTQLTGHREKVNAVRFVNGGTQVMSCSGGLLHGSEHSVFVWDVASGSLITKLGKQAAAVVGSCADSDGQAFFTLCWDGTVQAWDGRRVLNSTSDCISRARDSNHRV